jgi:hypothetical protein
MHLNPCSHVFAGLYASAAITPLARFTSMELLHWVARLC